MDIGKAVKHLRQTKAQQSQTDFAKNIGISQTYLSQVEGGKKLPSTELLQRICKQVSSPLPILFWFSIDESDLSPDKSDIFRALKPSVDALINELL